jgi:Iron-sulfur cluster-binding domain
MQHWRTTNFPTLEITTNIAAKGCVVDCAFCPQRTLEKTNYEGDRILSLDNFKMLIAKVPKEVRITFAGFTEPFLNKHCTDMVIHAHETGHPVSVFTTGVGMKPEDVYRLKDIPYAGEPNGGFCLHLPDEERIAKHPLNENYVRTAEKFYECRNVIKNFYVMSMSNPVHHAVKHLWQTAHVPQFWNRAGNLNREAISKPLNVMMRVVQAPVRDKPQTCGCVEGLYHNVLLPNGRVSLCCMDYSLDYIIGNLYETGFDDVVPKYKQTFDLCKSCENGIDP